MSVSDGQYEDEFTRLVEGKINGYVYDEGCQLEMFECAYPYDLEEFPPIVPPLGRTVAFDIDCMVDFDLVLDAMVAAIHKFFPGHTDVKQVQFPGECMDIVNLFQCKNADGEDQLFLFGMRAHGVDINYLSMIGPFDLNETGLIIPANSMIAHWLGGMERMDLIQLFNELTRMRQAHVLELERRSDLMAAATESLLDVDEGLGSIGADNLALVSQLLMRIM
jgi:hypothetical protein